MFDQAEVIHSYSRKQAIEDGILVDVSEAAREAGFNVHTVVTRAVWEECVAWSDEDNRRQTYQDESGRLWDVLWMGAFVARCRRNVSKLLYEFRCIPRGGRGRLPRKKVLKLHIGPGDEGEPVITIMLPNED